MRGLTGGQALNQSLNYSVGAFRASAIVNQALLGSKPHDLTGVVQGNEQVLQGFAQSGDALSSLVHTFNATMATLASRQQELSQTISLLPPLLRRTEAADTALDKSFGPTQQFAKDFLPGVKQLDPTIGAALPWIAQAKALVSKQELGGLLTDLTPAVQNTGSTIVATRRARFVGQSAGRVLHAHADPDGQRVRPGSARHDRAAALPGAVPERRRDRRRGGQLRRQRAVRAVVGGRRRHPGPDAVDPEPRPAVSATRSCPCSARARRTRARPRRCAVTWPAPRTPRRT